MGDYITQTEIETKIGLKKLIKLTDDSNSGTVDTNNMNRAIEDAEGEANAYIGKRYTVPLSPVPKIIKAMVLDMVAHKLYGRRVGATEDVTERYDKALAFLRRVAKNEVSLGADTPNPPGTDNKADIKGSDRLFTRDMMKGW